MSMFGQFKWERVGTEAIGSNPPLPIYRCEIGKDENGDVWLCQTKYRAKEKKYMVWFDKDVFTEDGCPFLRDEVVNSDNYWNAMKDYHMMVLCNYEDIQDHVRRVVRRNNLT